MKAKQKQGMAALEEFLQEKYVENYDGINEPNNKAMVLITLPSTSDYFYRPSVGVLKYVVDKDGHALYLINKNELPKEIRDNLVGGDANSGSYSDYQGLVDVYGVTSELKVYYCSNGADSILGVTKDELDIDDPVREVLPAGSPLAGLITGEDGKNVTAEDVKRVKELEIDGSKLSSLTDLYNLTSLENLTLTNYNGSMSGVEYATQISKIQIENSVISDYSSIGKMGKKLNKLYLYGADDGEISKLCSKTTGIANYDLENLNYFGIVGNKVSLDTVGYTLDQTVFVETKSAKTITKTMDFNNLTEKTKNAVKYLYVNNNKISDLGGFINFKNIILIRGEYNSLETLNGLQNMANLGYLIVQNNELGKNEVGEKNEETDALISLVGKANLKRLNLQNNKIIHITYIGKITSLEVLCLSGNSLFALEEIPEIANLFLGIAGSQKNINSVFLDYMQTSDNFKYKNLLATDTKNIDYLINLPQTEKNKVKYMDLSRKSNRR